MRYYCTAYLPIALVLSKFTRPGALPERGVGTYLAQVKEALVATNHRSF
jgi:hypothetical protein